MNTAINNVKVYGVTIPTYRVDNDANGNPRYIVHFLDLGLSSYDHTKETSSYFKKYRAKWFDGGFVATTYALRSTLESYFRDVARPIVGDWAAGDLTEVFEKTVDPGLAINVKSVSEAETRTAGALAAALRVGLLPSLPGSASEKLGLDFKDVSELYRLVAEVIVDAARHEGYYLSTLGLNEGYAWKKRK